MKHGWISRRYLGLELAGAKNQKTTLAVLEHYPKEQKLFLLDIYDRISGDGEMTGDAALLETIRESIQDFPPQSVQLAVNVPIDLPPCIECTRKTCPLPEKCTVPSVKWMRSLIKKGKKESPITPYTQRPMEIWIRHKVLPNLPEDCRFEIDEALGGSKAPRTARMFFLSRHLKNLVQIHEVWPKLSIALMAMDLGLSKKTLRAYRQLEEGVHARAEILDTLVKSYGIFIYERDMRKLSESLPAFDAFVCAFTCMMKDLGACADPPSGMPAHTGWVLYPDWKP